MTLLSRARQLPGPRSRRPAVVECVDSPQSTSGGRATTPRPAMPAARGDRAVPIPPPVLDIVIPVYNEERTLAASVHRLRAYLDARFPLPARITIADNASVDDTWPVAVALERDVSGVRALHLARKGRGRALRAAWLQSDAAVLAYMDVDLSTDLDGLLPLVAPLLSGHSDIAIGSRLAHGARVVRGPKREAISRAYNLILQTALGAGFRDAQCGFKAVRHDVARAMLPLVEDDGWFFDTELLVLAERAGLRIHEVPVDWIDDPDSRVHIASTASEDLKGVWRLLRRNRQVHLPGLTRRVVPRRALGSQIRRFAAIGIASTLAWAGLYSLLRGAGLGSVAANGIALAATAIGNTAANRRLTFGVTGRRSLAHDHGAGLLAFGLAIALTTASAAMLELAVPHPGRLVELAVLTVANLVATGARFVVLRSWFGRPSPVGVT